MAKQKKANATKAPAAAPVRPEIDTAATAAAAFVRNSGRAGKGGEAARRRESASFKQLKQGVEQPGAAGVSNLLDRSAPPGQQKSYLPLSGQGGNQKGHNQTIGSGASRTGVPRRTGG